jgi:hypothetical protein
MVDGVGDELDAELARIRDMARPVQVDEQRPDLGVADLAELVAQVDAAPAPSFLIRGAVAEGDYGMLAAEFKAGKTFAVDDLAVSVATGTPWLGLFAIDAPGPVLVFAGEGGKRKIVRRLRAICESRGLDVSSIPVRVALRVPHLTSEASMMLVEAEIVEHRPLLVVIDPLYLAAKGARGSDLYEMGAHLEGIQAVCQRYGAALLLSHHWNKTGTGKGAKRMSGAGPDAWGRFLISLDVISRSTDPVTKASTVILDLDFQGDEVAETTVRIRRRVWVDDPDDLASAMHYEVERIETSERTHDPALAGLRPSAVRVLDALEGALSDPTGISVRVIGDHLAGDGMGPPLKVRTIQAALKELDEAGLAELSVAGWVSTRAHRAESEAGNDA